jgi:hypothetical protein
MAGIASRGNVEQTCNAIFLEFVREPRVKRRRRLLIERYHGPPATAIGREIGLSRIKRKPLAIDVGRDTQARLPVAGTQPVRLVVVIPPLEFVTAADVAVVFRTATCLSVFLHISLHLFGSYDGGFGNQHGGHDWKLLFFLRARSSFEARTHTTARSLTSNAYSFMVGIPLHLPP